MKALYCIAALAGFLLLQPLVNAKQTQAKDVQADSGLITGKNGQFRTYKAQCDTADASACDQAAQFARAAADQNIAAYEVAFSLDAKRCVLNDQSACTIEPVIGTDGTTYAEAFALYRSACALGLEVSCTSSADMFYAVAKEMNPLFKTPRAIAGAYSACEVGDVFGCNATGALEAVFGPQTALDRLNRARISAQRGDVKFQAYLGEAYYFGSEAYGVDKDLTMAVYWLAKAAEGSDIDSTFYLATLYQFGEGIEKDIDKALTLYKRAAEAGDIASHLKVGFIFLNRDSARFSLSKAASWFEKVAYMEDMRHSESIGTAAMMLGNIISLMEIEKNGRVYSAREVAFLYQHASEMNDPEAEEVLRNHCQNYPRSCD